MHIGLIVSRKNTENGVKMREKEGRKPCLLFWRVSESVGGRGSQPHQRFMRKKNRPTLQEPPSSKSHKNPPLVRRLLTGFDEMTPLRFTAGRDVGGMGVITSSGPVSGSSFVSLTETTLLDVDSRSHDVAGQETSASPRPQSLAVTTVIRTSRSSWFSAGDDNRGVANLSS